jgi:dienelactone hydrolase
MTVERPVTVGSGATALPGVLTLPKGAGPFPVIVLEQGSGASDLDEWVPGFNIFPFHDLALGIAARGVAVLRYDKATWAKHFDALGIPPEQVTPREEYFNSLGAALELLAHTPDVDPKKIYVLGHSMGGWLLPWMMRDHPEIAGGIIASGNARSLLDVEVDQDQYVMAVNHPEVTKEQLAQLRAYDEAKRTRAHDPNLAEDTPAAQLPIGMSAHAVKSMQAYDAPTVIAAIDRPFLLLQGGRDYNVTMVDHEMWKKALAGKDVTAKVYDDLNHDYLTGTGMAKPEELKQGGHVAEPVLDDIAAWVKAVAGRGRESSSGRGDP